MTPADLVSYHLGDSPLIARLLSVFGQNLLFSNNAMVDVWYQLSKYSTFRTTKN